MEQILQTLGKYSSVWSILTEMPKLIENVEWVQLLAHLMPLFRKDTFHNIVKDKNYYPSVTPNCRYYIKPNNGSYGRGIQITNSYPLDVPNDCTVTPEIISPLIEIDGLFYKYDYRVWIGICDDLSYYICPTFIKRTSKVPFNIKSSYGSLTNTALYSEHSDCQNDKLYIEMDLIVKDILELMPKGNKSNCVMLTGWDFIEGIDGKLYVLEVNCNPSINLQHQQVMTEILNWINNL